MEQFQTTKNKAQTDEQIQKREAINGHKRKRKGKGRNKETNLDGCLTHHLQIAKQKQDIRPIRSERFLVQQAQHLDVIQCPNNHRLQMKRIELDWIELN